MGMLFVPSAFADVTSINFRDVQQNPDSFIGDSVNLTGKITADDFQGYGVAVEVGGLGIGMADISDRIKYQILFEKSQKTKTNTDILVDGNCVKITGEITGTITLSGFAGGEFTFPTAELFTVDVIDCIYGIYPVIGDLDYARFDENGVSLTKQNGAAKVTLKKMEFTTEHTRIFLDIENTGSSGKIEFNEQNSVIIQNDQQQLNAINTRMVRENPEKIDSTIHPGAMTSGWIIFETPSVSPIMADTTFEIRLNITDVDNDNDIIFLIPSDSFKLIGVYAESQGFVSGTNFAVVRETLQSTPEPDPEPTQQASGGCGEGTVLVNGVCQLASTGSDTGLPEDYDPLFYDVMLYYGKTAAEIIVVAIAVGGGIIVVIFAVWKRSKTPKPVKQKPVKKEETSAFCENCGNTLNPKAKFCGKCGNQV